MLYCNPSCMYQPAASSQRAGAWACPDCSRVWVVREQKGTSNKYWHGLDRCLDEQNSRSKIPWPDPTSAMIAEDSRFEPVWQCIKDWDIAVPSAYNGYSGATGNHVRAILDAMDAAQQSRGERPDKPDAKTQGGIAKEKGEL